MPVYANVHMCGCVGVYSYVKEIIVHINVVYGCV